MFQSLLEYTRIPLSIVLAGLAIKLLDDSLDENKLDYTPYVMCLICISVGLWNESLSLFLCSYIAGMFHDENLKLITKLKTYQEQIILFLVSVLITGFKATLTSLLVICTIQLLDDYIDQEHDKYECRKNWAIKFGSVETLLAAIIFFMISIYIDFFKTILCVSAALLISFIFNKKVNN